MKILLIQGSIYLPAHGGANKSNRLLMEALARRGHNCRVVAVSNGLHGIPSRASFLDELSRRGVQRLSSTADSDVFETRGVRVRAASDIRAATRWARDEMESFFADCILVASEDPGQGLLRCAAEIAAARVVYLARTTMMLPFGPESAFRNPSGAAVLREIGGVISVSEYLRNYMSEWGNIDSKVLPICLNGSGPFPNFGNFDQGRITMFNPCQYKGLSILLSLADRLRDYPFAVVKGWGTTAEDLRSLEACGNITVLEPCDRVDDIYSRCRILLVPSLWAEAKANVIGEALLRGIPVLASDVGGNSEAMCGLDYLLPVTPMTNYTADLDEKLLPKGAIPAQDDEPWCRALKDLLTNRRSYERLSANSRKIAVAANEGNTVLPLEAFLMHLNPANSCCQG